MSSADACSSKRRIAVSCVGRDVSSCTFEVTATVTDATNATVHLRGEMDMATAELVTAVLDSELAAGRRFIRLDLSGLNFLDCAGLRALVCAHNQILAARGTLVLAGAGARIERLLAITHLDEVLLMSDPSGTH